MTNPPLILITDDSESVTQPLSNLLKKAGYEVITANDGEQCLQLANQFLPQLVLIDLMLPKIHGMEILKTLKSQPHTKHIGVIISTGRGLLTDYQIAMECGADYFLIKPFDFHQVIKLVKQFFQGKLHPNAFPGTSHLSQTEEENLPYDPKLHSRQSYIKLWGTRGSITVSGIEYIRFGGNTSCLELKYGDEMVIIDAGTGIRELGSTLLQRSFRHLHLLIGHTHWDHIIGFPFFEPAYHPEFKIDCYGAKGFGKSLRDLFMSMLERDYFPVRLDEMQATLNFHDLQDTIPFEVGKIKIATAYATHPGATLCFKIITPYHTIGYATDNEFLVGYCGHPNLIHADHPRLIAYQNLIDFFKGCDLLIHEAQYTPHQYSRKIGWGHSSLANVAVLIKHCEIKRWLITHHDPQDDDTALLQKLQLARDILYECGIECEVNLAYDGIMIPLGF